MEESNCECRGFTRQRIIRSNARLPLGGIPTPMEYSDNVDFRRATEKIDNIWKAADQRLARSAINDRKPFRTATYLAEDFIDLLKEFGAQFRLMRRIPDKCV